VRRGLYAVVAKLPRGYPRRSRHDPPVIVGEGDQRLGGDQGLRDCAGDRVGVAAAARCHAGDPVGDSAVGVARRVDGAGGARQLVAWLAGLAFLELLVTPKARVAGGSEGVELGDAGFESGDAGDFGDARRACGAVVDLVELGDAHVGLENGVNQLDGSGHGRWLACLEVEEAPEASTEPASGV